MRGAKARVVDYSTVRSVLAEPNGVALRPMARRCASGAHLCFRPAHFRREARCRQQCASSSSEPTSARVWRASNSPTTSAPRLSRRSTTRCSSTKCVLSRSARPRRRRPGRLRATLGMPTTAHPTLTSRGERLLPIDSRYDKANSWHTDVTFVDRIPKRPCCGRSPSRLRRHHHLGIDRGRLRPAAGRHSKHSLRTCGRCTPTSTTMRASTARATRRRRRRSASTARSSCPTTTRPNTRSCGCIRRPVSACCCSGHFVK